MTEVTNIVPTAEVTSIAPGLQHISAGGLFVSIDFCLSILGTILNVIILATIKNSSFLLQDQYYSFLASLSLSNIIICSFLKLLSSVLCGHAVARNLLEVPFQFCNIYVVFRRLTWCVLPYTVFFIAWLDLVNTVRYKFLTSGSIDFESSSYGRKSVDEEGILTKRYLILKEYKYIQIIKSLKSSQQNKKNSTDGSDSLHSIKNKWKSKIKTNKKLDSEKFGSISRKWKENTFDKKKDELKRQRVMKQKSKSFDDELELDPGHRVQMEKKQSYSCSELPQLYSIREEGDTSIRNIAQSKTYRRKMFAKSKTQQVTMSFSPASSLSSEPQCIITLSSPESTAPVRIFPDTAKDEARYKQDIREIPVLKSNCRTFQVFWRGTLHGPIPKNKSNNHSKVGGEYFSFFIERSEGRSEETSLFRELSGRD